MIKKIQITKNFSILDLIKMVIYTSEILIILKCYNNLIINKCFSLFFLLKNYKIDSKFIPVRCYNSYIYSK